MKAPGWLLLLLVFQACAPTEEGLRPLRDLRAFHLQGAQRLEVTAWLQFREELSGVCHAYLREETHTFSNGDTGISYTVFTPEFEQLGQISATGQVVRWVRHRRTQDWRPEDLGAHSLEVAVAMLTGLDQETIDRSQLVPMGFRDVGGG